MMKRFIGLVLVFIFIFSIVSCSKSEKKITIGYKQDFPFADQIWEPCDMTVDSAGNLYILDRFEGACVHKFDPTGVYLGKMGGLGKERGYLFLPLSVAVDEVGDVWVADRVNKRVTRFSNTGECLLTVEAGENFQMQAPEAMVVGGDGAIYIADSLADSIWRIEPYGVAELYKGPQELNAPEDILWLDDGLLIADTGAERLVLPDGSIQEIYDLEGEKVRPHKIKVFSEGFALIVSLSPTVGKDPDKFQPYLLLLDGEFKTTAEHKLDPELVGDVQGFGKDTILVSYPKLNRVVEYRVKE
jgi:sugar lactone lactonase YvrE